MKKLPLTVDVKHIPIDYLRGIMKAADKYDVLELLQLSLAPVVLHELGHLASQGSGRFWMYAVQSTDDNRAVLAEEEAADAYANSRLRVLLNRAMIGGNILPVESTIAAAKLMRDKVLFEAFSGFRGLSAEDLFINLFHWNCRERPDTRSLPFDDLGKVRTGLFAFTPLLTSDEFASISDKLLLGVRSGTHSHHFLRADRMLSMIQEQVGWNLQNILGSQLLLLDSVLKGEPKEFAPQVEGKTGLSFNALTDHLGLRFQLAVNCPVEECWIGTFDDGSDGFLEIVGPSHDIRYARLMVPMFGSEPFVELSRRKDVEGYIMMIAFFLRFLSNVTEMEWEEFDADWRQRPLGKLLADTREQAFECGAVTRIIPLKNRNLIVRTVNERGWMSFEIME